VDCNSPLAADTPFAQQIFNGTSIDLSAHGNLLKKQIYSKPIFSFLDFISITMR